MKISKFKLSLISLTLSFITILNGQEETSDSETRYVTFGFYKVDENKRSEYETLMTDFFGPLMQKRVDEGCLAGWLFRRVHPNSSLFNEFTHLTIDIMPYGEKTYQSCDANLDEVFEGLSKNLREFVWKQRNSFRKVILRAQTTGVTGFTESGKSAQIAVYNFTKTLTPMYEKKHLDNFGEFIVSGSSRVAWYAFKRIDPTAWASKEWDYLTVDGYENLQQLNEPSQFSQVKLQYYDEKYGLGSEQRDIMSRAVTELIFGTKVR